MTYTTIVTRDESGLQMILDAANLFEEKKFLNGLQQCRFTIEKVVDMTIKVKEIRTKLDREHLALAKFALVFNKKYATEHNECFDTAEKLFRKIRSTISGSKKIYKKFCVPNRRRIKQEMKLEKSAFKLSTLTKNYLSGQMFGLDSYDGCVLTLYNELEGFFFELIKCLALCRFVINEERNIRNTPDWCREIYKDCYNTMVENSKELIRVYSSHKKVSKDEYMERKRNAKSLDTFICENFHKMTTTEFKNLVILDMVEKGEKDGLSEVESALWNNNIEIVKKVRTVISHFDELEPEGQKGKLSGYAVASFMSWCGIGENDNKVKTFVEEYFNKEYKGSYSTIRTNSVNTAKNNMTKGTSTFDKDSFVKKIDELLSHYTRNTEDELKFASGF